MADAMNNIEDDDEFDRLIAGLAAGQGSSPPAGAPRQQAGEPASVPPMDAQAVERLRRNPLTSAGGGGGDGDPLGQANVNTIVGSARRRGAESLARLEQQAEREQRRRRILRILGGVLSFVAPGAGAGLMAGSGMVRAPATDALARRRAQIAQQAAERRQREETRREQAIAQATAARQQAAADRDYALDRERLDLQARGVDSLIARRESAAEDADQRIAQSQQRIDLARSRRSGGGGSGGGTSRVYRAGEPSDLLLDPAALRAAEGETSEAQAARLDRLRRYVRAHQANDPELVERALQARGIDPATADANIEAAAAAIRPYEALSGEMRGRMGSARGRALSELEETMGRREPRGSGAGPRGVATRRAALERQVSDAEEAADAMQRIVRRLGPGLARVARGEGVMADMTAALAGADVETDVATFRNFASELLHERGGASLTPQEKAIIRGALASGSLLTSPEATIRTLRNLAARARGEAGQLSGGAAPAQGGTDRVIATRTVNGVLMEMVERPDGSRYTRRAQ